ALVGSAFRFTGSRWLLPDVKGYQESRRIVVGLRYFLQSFRVKFLEDGIVPARQDNRAVFFPLHEVPERPRDEKRWFLVPGGHIRLPLKHHLLEKRGFLEGTASNRLVGKEGKILQLARPGNHQEVVLGL